MTRKKWTYPLPPSTVFLIAEKLLNLLNYLLNYVKHVAVNVKIKVFLWKWHWNLQKAGKQRKDSTKVCSLTKSR